MSDMHALTSHLNHWGDKTSLDKLRNSEKSMDVHCAEITNHLVDLGQRFTYSPDRGKLSYWSRDLVQSGIKEHHVKEACEIILRQFEKYPTLSQIFSLCRVKGSGSPLEKKDPQTEKDFAEMNRIKEIWTEKVGIELLPKMCQSYCKNVLGLNVQQLNQFGLNGTIFEMLVLFDWKRSGFGNAESILKQGKMSLEKFQKEKR